MSTLFTVKLLPHPHRLHILLFYVTHRSWPSSPKNSKIRIFPTKSSFGRPSSKTSKFSLLEGCCLVSCCLMAAPIQVFLAGASGVGKSSLSTRLFGTSEGEPTAEVPAGDGLPATALKLVGDAAAAKDDRRAPVGSLLVFDVTQRESFEQLAELHQKQIPAVVVGNKCDLEDEREVTTEEGEKLAASLSCTYVEASAETGDGVEDAFTEIARVVKAEQQPPAVVGVTDELLSKGLSQLARTADGLRLVFFVCQKTIFVFLQSSHMCGGKKTVMR
jgi:RNase H-fold protein (predicted Holliday junction resolvase)